MISTPICDFVRHFSEQEAARFFMPGHKGALHLGCEPLDITEFDGADNLYDAQGIIAQSEANAGSLFGCHTFYSTEGASLAIRAMLFLAMKAAQGGEKPCLLAARNAHKTLVHTAALLDFSIEWLDPQPDDAYHVCRVSAEEVERRIEELRTLSSPNLMGVYLTSPDYLGHLADVKAIADVCHRRGLLLLVDNAHGAYLKFLPQSLHPIDLGADLCCDSAHKTLPVLTGGAYLQIAKRHESMAEAAKTALALFGSTSPSYLILQSLDAANPYMETLRERCADFLSRIRALKQALCDHGFTLCGDEPWKISIRASASSRTGDELADILRKENIYCEFHDPDDLVLMLTPDNRERDCSKVRDVLCGIALASAQDSVRRPPAYRKPEPILSPREAILSQSEMLPVEQCIGRICAEVSSGCPPAVPIVVSGERIDREAVERFRYYGIKQCIVVKE